MDKYVSGGKRNNQRAKIATILIGLLSVAVLLVAVQPICAENIREKREGIYRKYPFKAKLMQAANAGNACAMEVVGHNYCYGHHDMYHKEMEFEKNEREGNKWYRKAIEVYKIAEKKGDYSAMYGLSTIHYHFYVGSSLKDKNEEKTSKYYYKRALETCRKSAENGNIEAMYDMGYMYDYGPSGVGGPECDSEEAAKWYHKAAEKGYTDAMEFLGSMYSYGRGVPQDEYESTRWYRKGAEAGSIGCMLILGNKFRSLGADTEAAKWFKMAADKGNPEAAKLLQELLNRKGSY